MVSSYNLNLWLLCDCSVFLFPSIRMVILFISWHFYTSHLYITFIKKNDHLPHLLRFLRLIFSKKHFGSKFAKNVRFIVHICKFLRQNIMKHCQHFNDKWKQFCANNPTVSFHLKWHVMCLKLESAIGVSYFHYLLSFPVLRFCFVSLFFDCSLFCFIFHLGIPHKVKLELTFGTAWCNSS